MFKKTSILTIILLVIVVLELVVIVSFKVNSTSNLDVTAQETKYVYPYGYAVLWLGNVICVIPPNTVAQIDGKNYTTFNVTLMLLGTKGFALSVDGHTQGVKLFSKGVKPFFVVFGPTTLSVENVSYGGFNGDAFVGVNPGQLQHVLYGDGVLALLNVTSTGVWEFVTSQKPFGSPPKEVNVPVSDYGNLTPISAKSFEINGSDGGVTVDGNLIVIVQPGTLQKFPNETLSVYNLSLVYYSPYDVPLPPIYNQYPEVVFAYAVNGIITPDEKSTKPYITLILAPSSQHGYMWDYYIINGKLQYKEDPAVLVGQKDDLSVIINLTFKRPVPWVYSIPSV
ncbi:hypothetical protein [Stygiolobus caldivivus]|uniref:Uncharacterized protein n=1 Tax=Stygiolobus caldivivus TaxID=2824673 RepID=A0A8D5U6T6_9CREN|nr:hypothetical protein [Stygiolobus caldivivus]BCU69891.1 hypothetical protein KN1_11880 [Stygiolobus caldivivus]